MRVNDLTDAILANVARYLAAPSAAMFSIAVTQDGASSNWVPTQTSNAIISAAASTSNNNNEQQLQVLDFGDIEKDLAAKLSDEDIRDVLLCIDSQNKGTIQPHPSLLRDC